MWRIESLLAAALAGMALLAGTPIRAEEPAYRYRALVTVEQAAAFVQLPLPASVYGRSLGPGLQDLRMVDARGERVPFALLAARAPLAQRVDDQRAAVLYPLTARPAANGAWSAPVDVLVQAGRVTVRSRAPAPQAVAKPASAGWLFDLGERRKDDPVPQSLQIGWSAPAEFAATFQFDTSDDLRSWRSGGAGQLMALRSAAGPLTQPTVLLPGDVGRFVRLFWIDPATAPVVSGATVSTARQTRVALDPPTELVLAASPAPAGRTPTDPPSTPVLDFDLGGILPLEQVDLRLAPGTRVVPVRLQGRDQPDGAWRELGAGVFYRLERGTDVSVSPPMVLNTSVRYLRVRPDERAAALDSGTTRLVVRARLASLVFASQGNAPYSLLAGAEKATPSALPVASLVPDLDAERPRFGRAALGEWVEEASVARATAQKKRIAAMRPWLLWALLLAGVAGLAFMVWRLARPAGRAAAVQGVPR